MTFLRFKKLKGTTQIAEVNDLRENLPLHVENRKRNVRALSRDL